MDDRAKNLYALPLEEFVAERNALARKLRETGEREAAAEVRSLRKPTVAAWAVNQLSHRRSQQVGRFLDVADQLRQAQRQAVSGGESGGELREAITAYRETVDELSGEAAEILDEAGTSAVAHMAEVTATLHAAAVDEEARRHLREGTLTRPVTAAGLGGLTAGLAIGELRVDPALGKRESRPDELARRSADQARERERKARQRLDALEQATHRLQRRAERAEKRAQRLASAAEEAERDAQHARQSADEALEAAQRVRRELEEAERATKEADGS